MVPRERKGEPRVSLKLTYRLEGQRRSSVHSVLGPFGGSVSRRASDSHWLERDGQRAGPREVGWDRSGARKAVLCAFRNCSRQWWIRVVISTPQHGVSKRIMTDYSNSLLPFEEGRCRRPQKKTQEKPVGPDLSGKKCWCELSRILL